MSEFKSLLDRFDDHEKNLKDLGGVIVERYPQSKNLISLVQELGAAVDGLAALKARLGEAIHEAETQQAQIADLYSQIEKSEIFQTLSERDKQKLIEHLTQNQAGLASEEELEAYVKRSLEQKTDAELIAEFSKAHILELGQSLFPDGDAFDAYKGGVDALMQQFADPAKKGELLTDLAKVLLKESPNTALKLFYGQAFKQPEQEQQFHFEEIPIIAPQAGEEEAPTPTPMPEEAPGLEPVEAPPTEEEAAPEAPAEEAAPEAPAEEAPEAPAEDELPEAPKEEEEEGKEEEEEEE